MSVRRDPLARLQAVKSCNGATVYVRLFGRRETIEQTLLSLWNFGVWQREWTTSQSARIEWEWTNGLTGLDGLPVDWLGDECVSFHCPRSKWLRWTYYRLEVGDGFHTLNAERPKCRRWLIDRVAELWHSIPTVSGPSRQYVPNEYGMGRLER